MYIPHSNYIPVLQVCAKNPKLLRKNTKNKQQMESRIHHEPDIRLLAEDKGLAVWGKKYSCRLYSTSWMNLLVTHHSTERSE